MKVFVTGATGAIGRRALPVLVAQGHEVTAATRPGSWRAVDSRDGVTSVVLDIFDREAAARAMRGHDVVVNLATRIPTGMVRPFLPGAWRETTRIRRDASRALSDAAREAGVARFIQESFAPIYEDAGAEWITERSPMRPARYNRAVLDAEQSAQRFAEGGGAGVVLRFAYFYGGAEDPFTRLMLDTVRRGWNPVMGRADGYFSTVHHDDAASAVVAALGVPAGTWNVANDEPLTRRALGEALATVVGVKAPRMLPAWMARLGGAIGETLGRSLRISNRAFREASGWVPRYASAREGWQGA
jgi:2-alkyl-3-oxoalkanoate reductase